MKQAKRDSRCTACRGRIYKGDEATYVTARTRRFHNTCTPAGIENEGATAARPAAPVMPRNPAEAAQQALAALENALVVRVKTEGISDEMEKDFATYQKLKSLALNEGAFDNEAKIALRNAIVRVVKLVF